MNSSPTTYLTIPRESIMNHQKRKHRGNQFRTIYYYRGKRRFSLNYETIEEIDIYDFKETQINTIYKSCYKSKKDKYFDWFYMLKEEYNDCNDGVYIRNEDSRNKKKPYQSLTSNQLHNYRGLHRGQIVVEFD